MTTLTDAQHTELFDAIGIDHPCEDYAACDIARSRRDGYLLTSAWLLLGATEAPHTDATLRRHSLTVTPFPADLEDWRADVVERHGARCGACNGISYGEGDYDVEVCAHCGADDIELITGEED